MDVHRVQLTQNSQYPLRMSNSLIATSVIKLYSPSLFPFLRLFSVRSFIANILRPYDLFIFEIKSSVFIK